ncbi:DUF1642 domain-containing protein [Streptococcus parauberis]|uniref:DUF1642 domain-containing protein n=1 Tax=Streptococcus parauberis TaxID=1348 RepID=UPI00020CBF25|nr:DUF1642 domain-containing protein [Streptococcus parauberis]AEF25308.1 hypothetical protein STP_0860 [Streptococcus parauberis KCTC 11537]QBX17931.1 hypothetical protein Javan385_0028 [Streptococcus phage Javan385]UWM91873.1 DUF1642 domain-containing protein [Streptococcus parauberis]
MIEQIQFKKTYYLPVRVTEFNHEVGDEEPTVRLVNLSGRHQLVDFEQNIMKELVEIDLRIDQPKPVVPKFVADWIEKYKEQGCRLSHALENVFDDVELSLYIKQQESDYTEIIAKAWLYGYTVEKEKLYTVKILGCTLFKMTSDNHVRYKLIGENETPSESKFSSYKFEADLTEQEIKQADERLWQFAKEVTE